MALFKTRQPQVVVIGGGTGTSQLLRGLKHYPISLSAVVTTSDTGGSSGVLRREVGMSPPGDVRQCFVALNRGSNPFIRFFNDRFPVGALKGHSFGNLFFAFLVQKYKDFPKAVREAERMVDAVHRVIPVTHTPTNLVARLEDGSVVSQEHDITEIQDLQKKLKKIELEPKGVKVNREARQAILNADVIVIGPGNLIASLTPPLLVNSIAEALIQSPAQKVFVVNLMNQKNLTGGFEVEDYLFYFDYIIGVNIFDTVIYNTAEISEQRLKELQIKDEVVEAISFREGMEYIGRSLVSQKNVNQNKNDLLNRTLIKHDEKKIAKLIYDHIIKKRSKRDTDSD